MVTYFYCEEVARSLDESLCQLEYHTFISLLDVLRISHLLYFFSILHYYVQNTNSQTQADELFNLIMQYNGGNSIDDCISLIYTINNVC